MDSGFEIRGKVSDQVLLGQSLVLFKAQIMGFLLFRKSFIKDRRKIREVEMYPSDSLQLAFLVYQMRFVFDFDVRFKEYRLTCFV